jgi:hypothetical protein
MACEDQAVCSAHASFECEVGKQYFGKDATISGAQVGYRCEGAGLVYIYAVIKTQFHHELAQGQGM